jgi:hypothetical protein
MWSLHEWCPSNSPWTVHGAINTCWLESGGVAAVVLAFVVALGCSWSALRLVEDLRARGGSLKGPIGMSGKDTLTSLLGYAQHQLGMLSPLAAGASSTQAGLQLPQAKKHIQNHIFFCSQVLK